MRQVLGIQSEAELFQDIPAEIRQRVGFDVLPAEGLSELELQQLLQEIGERNTGARMACFLGGGAYDRFIPPAVNTIAGRSEFATAYTPYQPEISQGTLQVIYEFQSMMAELTGMDVANASVYDGGSAVVEAAFMAFRATKRPRMLVARTVHPDTRQMLATYAEANGTVSVTEFDPTQGPQALDGIDPKAVACVILQTPNYLGEIETTEPWRAFCEASKALLVVSADPISLGLLEAPGQYGADIVVGDIQPLGNPLNFGGPYGGYVATKKAHVRQLPGRIVGRAVDKDGRPCFTLTLQTREQHIRREKATSNICTNQALNILRATVALTLFGPTGLQQLATISVQRAHWLAERLCEIPGVRLLRPERPFFSEFALALPTDVETVIRAMEDRQILAGIPLKRAYPEHADGLLVAVTEKNTPQELERYVEAMKQSLAGACSEVNGECLTR